METAETLRKTLKAVIIDRLWEEYNKEVRADYRECSHMPALEKWAKPALITYYLKLQEKRLKSAV